MKKIDENIPIASVAELEKELKRVRYWKHYWKTLRSTICTLITVAAFSFLMATLFLPVLQIYGGSMAPTLNNGETVLAWKTNSIEKQDIIAFYYNNKILVKRVIAKAGEWVDIDPDGNVTVNGELLDEPYAYEKVRGECDIELPYQVPDGRIFVLGDHRNVSIDSRSNSVGCVSEEQLVGKVFFRIWPFNRAGRTDGICEGGEEM